MRFLGEYNSEVANTWKDKLEDEDIFPTVEEVGGFFGGSFAIMGEIKPRLRIFVEDNDYDKAVSLIKELERHFEKQMEIDGKEANDAMLKVVFVIACIFAIGICLTYFRH